MANDFFKIIKRPMISEKNFEHSGKGIYAFEVSPDCTKTQIATAIEKAFRVKVTKVNTMVGRGRHRQQGRYQSRIHKTKKALVWLAEGQKMPLKIFEGV